MAGKLCNFGERLILGAACPALGPLTLHLIKAPFIPSDTQLVADLTQADYPGYAAQTLVYSALQAGNPGGRAVADYVALTFTCTGSAAPNQIYGYWVEDAAHNVVFVERFNGNPRPMIANGQTVVVAVKLRLYSPT